MSKVVSISIESGAKQWIDITDPSTRELSAMAKKYGLHPVHVKNCLDANHLPKYEETENSTFIIARGYDSESNSEIDTIQNLTRKIAIFITPTVVLSIHRVDSTWLQQLRERWQTAGNGLHHTHLVNAILSKVFGSYTVFVDRMKSDLDNLEEGILLKRKNAAILEKFHQKKKLISIIGRVIQMLGDSIPESESDANETPYLRDLEEKIRRILFSLDDLELRIAHMLQLHLAIESQKNNDVVRVLTLFSAFFLPLTFIAGIYGMNFNHMPELHWAVGYPLILGFMAITALAIWIWFKRKGWMDDI